VNGTWVEELTNEEFLEKMAERPLTLRFLLCQDEGPSTPKTPTTPGGRTKIQGPRAWKTRRKSTSDWYREDCEPGLEGEKKQYKIDARRPSVSDWYLEGRRRLSNKSPTTQLHCLDSDGSAELTDDDETDSPKSGGYDREDEDVMILTKSLHDAILADDIVPLVRAISLAEQADFEDDLVDKARGCLEELEQREQADCTGLSEEADSEDAELSYASDSDGEYEAINSGSSYGQGRDHESFSEFTKGNIRQKSELFGMRSMSLACGG